MEYFDISKLSVTWISKRNRIYAEVICLFERSYASKILPLNNFGALTEMPFFHESNPKIAQKNTACKTLLFVMLIFFLETNINWDLLRALGRPETF